MKQALGLAVSGTEVRLAHLISHNGQIRIEGLEAQRLVGRGRLERHAGRVSGRVRLRQRGH